MFCQRQTSAGAQNPLRSHPPHPDTHGSQWLLLRVTDLKLNLRTTSTILSFYQSSERASNWPKVTQQERLKHGGHPCGLTPSLGSCAAQCCSQRRAKSQEWDLRTEGTGCCRLHSLPAPEAWRSLSKGHGDERLPGLTSSLCLLTEDRGSREDMQDRPLPPGFLGL